MRDLQKKRVLVTGAASGIGLALAIGFAREGAEIVAADIDEEGLPSAERAIREAGGKVASYPVDVTDRVSVLRLRNRVGADLGPIDVLVNNAGVVFGGSFVDVPMDRHILTYRVNVEGYVSMTHAFLPDLVARSEAHLVNMASASGLIGLPHGATYASSKWATIGFSDSIRLELEVQGHRHVGVTTVCPSYVDTGMFNGVRPPRLTRMLTPERLASLIIRAVKRNRPFVLTPWLVRMTPFLKGVLPVRGVDALSALFGATRGMLGWKGRGRP